ncbi:hypothetical protein [Ornithinibacillus californiensis]|uniref:hypothetical protein n=1 Tax=Ornithinibacillus californiensis TaxID=161536 RepID=UPI00064DA474|nr:hypothetical protein [Ornithinibacillus californiensis]
MLLLGILTIVLTITGCGKDKVTISGENAEIISFNEDDGDFTITNEKGESVSYSEDEDGNVSITGEGEDGESFSMNSGTELPKEFPEEIPLPDKFVVTSAFNLSE